MYRQSFQTMVEDVLNLSVYAFDEMLASYAFAH